MRQMESGVVNHDCTLPTHGSASSFSLEVKNRKEYPPGANYMVAGGYCVNLSLESSKVLAFYGSPYVPYAMQDNLHI